MLFVLDKNKKSNLFFSRIRVLYTNGLFIKLTVVFTQVLKAMD